MSYPHRIRLRGPWEHEPLAREAGEAALPPPGPLRLPARWADGPLAGFAGRVRLRRHFGYPGHLDENERVFLVIDGAAGCRAVAVNDTAGPAPAGDAYEWDVTALLRARNALRLEVEGGPERDGLPGEVALEVRCTAWLRNVVVEPCGEGLKATGEVVGHAPAALDLYLIADRSPADQASVRPSDAGERFCLVSPAPARCATIDLVLGAVVWYRAQRQL
jgi:hypothetical protein